MKIAVIGSGIAGLAVAVRLQKQGHQVTVYEQNESIGGKISEVKKDGFTWDGGPSFFTDPGELKRLFTDAGVVFEDYFAYRELTEACRYFYGKHILRGYDEPAKLAKEIHRVFQEHEEHTLQFLHDAQTIYDNTGEAYLDYPFSLKRVLSPKLIKAFLKTPKRAIFTNMHENHRHYFGSAKTVQFFDRFATYNGSDSTRAPGLLSCMPHLEHNVGAVQPVGGMRSIVTSVAKLALGMGVTVKLRTTIDRLYLEDKTVRGVMIEGKKYEYDRVVNAAEVASIMRWHNKKQYDAHAKKEQSASAVVLYLGVKKTKLPLYLHNIFFSQDYAAETRALWQTKQPYCDPTIYINNTSFFEPSHAPKGHQNWFVMVNVPAGMSEIDTALVRSYTLSKLSKICNTDVRSLIVSESTALSPTTIQQKFNAHQGSIYGLASNSWRGAFFRHANKDKKFKNLYHCGVTTHPGGGIPLALRSARIVSGLVGK